MRNKYSALLLLAVIVLGTAFWLWLNRKPELIHDAQVREHYSENASAFDELRDMMLADSRLCGVGDDFICVHLRRDDKTFSLSYHHTGGSWNCQIYHEAPSYTSANELLQAFKIDIDRYNHYLELLKEVEAERIVKGEYNRSNGTGQLIRIWLSSEGIVPSGRIVGVVYFVNGISKYRKVVADTGTLMGKGEVYAPLEQNWYIYREQW